MSRRRRFQGWELDDPRRRDRVTDLVIFVGIVIFVLFVGTVWAIPG